MKYIFIPVILLASFQLNAQLYIAAGTEIKLSNNALVTLQDINLVNNGTINVAPGEGTFRFSGIGDNTISGANAPLFDILQIAKTGTARISLLRSINIGSSINFTSGALDLNNNNILLNPAAALIGESETSRIIGPNGGYVEITNVLNNPSIVNPGNLGAAISSTANLGATIIRRGHQSQTNGSGAGNSIFRYFDILPANNNALNATLNFSYFDADLNTLTEPALTLWKSLNTTTWSDQGFDRRSAVTNYVEKSGIANFSRWTISSPGNPLPVVFSLFNVKCNNNKVDINWKTASEQNSSHFEVQRSDNANNWSVIGSVPAAGNSTTEKNYSFVDNNPLASASFYRIAEFDMDGKIQYTGIIKNDCDQTGNIKLWPNPVETQLYISINSSGRSNASINLYDAKGALIRTQQTALITGNNLVNIDMSSLPNGIYHVAASWNQGSSQQSFKIIKQ